MRHNSADLPSIRESRLRHGPAVELIDLSAGGALLEADIQMRPGARLALEIAGNDEEPAIVAMRVLRCEVAAIGAGGTTYRGAGVFVRPLDLRSLLPAPLPPAPPVRPFIGLDGSLRLLAERYRLAADGLKTPDVIEVLRTLQSRALGPDEDPLGRPLTDLLPAVAAALDQREPADAVLRAIESRLRDALPQIEIHLTDAPLPTGRGAETILFRPEQPTDLACVLNVQLPQGASLADWQFRLLKASMHLCSLLDAGGARIGDAARTTGSPWQKIVVRYKDGRLVKGFSHDFHPSRSQFAIWPTVNAAEQDGIVVPVAGLKAVFFVRDFRGDATYVEDKQFDQATHGRRVEVTFFDGEVLAGTTLSYRPDGQGFFLNPADPRANNVRVFVVTAAVRHVRFLGNGSSADL